MDIHRCRFVSYPPAAINALAFSHASSLTSTRSEFPCLRLAVGRANGDLEIWNPLKTAWHQESVIHGGKDRSIEGLAWTQDPDGYDKNGVKLAGQSRLFSIGCSTAVTEWDLALGRAQRHSSGNHGEIWCIAAQPKTNHHGEKIATGQIAESDGSDLQQQSIVVGCADGAIILLSTADKDLRFLKTLARPSKRKARVLSITFKNRDIVLAGHADSTIRVFDTRNGRQIHNISLGPGPRGGPKEILVWSVRSLPNGWIISGDSTGTVRFWDGKHYSLVQRIQGHLADILDVVASADGETIISGGMDRRTTVYRRMGTGSIGERRRWAEISHRRLHKHDVKAMATFETENSSVLASGGLDTSPIMVPIREFERENHLTLSNLPHSPPVGGAPKERLMMSWWGSEIRIWRFARRQPRPDVMAARDTLDATHAKKLVARVLMQGDEALTCADLTLDGNVLVASTISGVKLFRLRRKADDGLKVSKLEVSQSISEIGAKIVKFSPDGHWLILIRPNSDVEIYRVVSEGLVARPGAVSLKRSARDHLKIGIQCGNLGRYKRSVSQVAFSADSKILVTGDMCGYLDSWVLEDQALTRGIDEADDAANSSPLSDVGSADENDSPDTNLGPRWIRNPAALLIPQLPTAPLILTFRPTRKRITSKAPNGHTAVHSTHQMPDLDPHCSALGEDRLFVMTCDHQMFEFSVLSGKLSDWSRRNPTTSLPSKFRKLLERAKGSIWDINKPAKERIWVYGNSWLWMFDLSQDFPVEVEAGNDTTHDEVANKGNGTRGVKRKRRSVDTQEAANKGAGSKDASGMAPDFKFGIGSGRKHPKNNMPGVGLGRWASAEGEPSPASDRDDAVHEPNLIFLRRDSHRRARTDENLFEDVKTVNGQTQENTPDVQVANARTHSGLPYWGTHKYRDILGIVALDDDDEEKEQRVKSKTGANELPRGLEVVLIERPLWEVDLPPKYYGNQEWDK